MAPTPLTVQTITETGMTPVAPVNGDNTNTNSVVGNGGNVWLEASNTGASSATYTVAFGQPVKGQTIPPVSFTVAAGASHRAGPFDPAIYGSTLVINPSASTLKLAAFQWTR